MSFPLRTPPKNRLLVFARVPELGLVKTRLARDLGAERALELHRALLDDLLHTLGPSEGETEVEVVWTGSEAVTGAQLREAFGDRRLSRQAGPTLGGRLAVAFSERIHFHAAEKVIAIGTDEPTLDQRVLSNAFDLLDSCDWVVGPATDGGYYLIGCRGPAYNTDVFQGIQWGSASVFQSTSETIRRVGATLALLPQRTDIDQAADLQRLAPDLAATQRTGGLLRAWGWI